MKGDTFTLRSAVPILSGVFKTAGPPIWGKNPFLGFARATDLFSHCHPAHLVGSPHSYLNGSCQLLKVWPRCKTSRGVSTISPRCLFRRSRRSFAAHRQPKGIALAVRMLGDFLWPPAPCDSRPQPHAPSPGVPAFLSQIFSKRCDAHVTTLECCWTGPGQRPLLRDVWGQSKCPTPNPLRAQKSEKRTQLETRAKPELERRVS